jgi:hypothetical protein
MKNIKITKTGNLRYRGARPWVLTPPTTGPLFTWAIGNQHPTNWQGSQENERQSAKSCVPNSLSVSLRASYCLGRILDFSPTNSGDLGA